MDELFTETANIALDEWQANATEAQKAKGLEHMDKVKNEQGEQAGVGDWHQM